VQEAELRYPIIRATNGAVMDGMHRVSKALIKGRHTIEAVQFDTQSVVCNAVNFNKFLDAHRYTVPSR